MLGGFDLLVHGGGWQDCGGGGVTLFWEAKKGLLQIIGSFMGGLSETS